MAKTSYQLIPPEFDAQYKKALQSGDRFQFPRVRRKIIFSSRSKKKGLTQKSLIPILSPVWASFTIGEKDAWNSAGVASNLTGWKLFLKDTALRIANEISGYATPNDLYQAKVGRLSITSPATNIKIAQLHPQTYYVNRKVQGTRSQYEPVKIVEVFGLPIEIKASFKTVLTSAGVGAYAKFYVIVYSNYQGRIIENKAEIDMGLSTDWTRQTVSVSSVTGIFTGYTIFFEVYNATGDVYFDDIEANHSGHNWARDPNCDDIDQAFTKAFAQIPKHWIDIDVPDGAFFGSVYYN